MKELNLKLIKRLAEEHYPDKPEQVDRVMYILETSPVRIKDSGFTWLREVYNKHINGSLQKY